MRLINVQTMRVEEILNDDPPQYYILSHTWASEEVSYQDFTQTPNRASRMAGYDKIRRICQLAQEARVGYAWVDTCCIDKTSSAELSEAINSMYRWYKGAVLCVAFLADFEFNSVSDLKYLSLCRWFTRGWCLQELVAPFKVAFVDKSWTRFGTRSELSEVLHEITGVSKEMLQSDAPSMVFDIDVATRMSWAARRQTQRPEDMAYCLLGIFNVNMPLLYGEGRERAFLRLQEEIVRTTEDWSIFAWVSHVPSHQRITLNNWGYPVNWSGVFASGPADFSDRPGLDFHPDPDRWFTEASITSRGIKFSDVHLIRMQDATDMRADDVRILPLGRKINGELVGIYIFEARPDNFVRVFPHRLSGFTAPDKPSLFPETASLSEADAVLPSHRDLTMYIPRVVGKHDKMFQSDASTRFARIECPSQFTLVDVYPSRRWRSTQASFSIDAAKPGSLPFVTFYPAHSSGLLTLFINVFASPDESGCHLAAESVETGHFRREMRETYYSSGATQRAWSAEFERFLQRHGHVLRCDGRTVIADTDREFTGTATIRLGYAADTMARQ